MLFMLIHFRKGEAFFAKVLERCIQGYGKFHGVKRTIGTDVYEHLTGSGAQSLKYLLPIFDPDGVSQNPSDFFCFFVVWDF